MEKCVGVRVDVRYDKGKSFGVWKSVGGCQVSVVGVGKC